MTGVMSSLKYPMFPWIFRTRGCLFQQGQECLSRVRVVSYRRRVSNSREMREVRMLDNTES